MNFRNHVNTQQPSFHGCPEEIGEIKNSPPPQCANYMRYARIDATLAAEWSVTNALVEREYIKAVCDNR